MNNWKVWVESLKAKPFSALGLLVLLALPVTLLLVFRSQDTRSSAAAPDKLETEAGVLTSTGVSKQNDTGASGGSYVLFNRQVSGPTPTTAPNPTSPPSQSSSMYGSGMGMESLANTNTGGNGIWKITMRFKADQSAKLNSFRTYIQSYDISGDYGGGNGGIIRFTLQTDDGSSNHYPSGQVLATAPDIVHPTSVAGMVVSFSNPATLTKGTLYHIVAENVDPSRNSNYFSGNYIYNPSAPNQPKFGSETNWGHAYYEGSWVTRPGFSPILDLSYSNGQHQGMGYMELGSMQRIGGSNSVRQRITPTSTRTISKVSVNTRRTSGSSPLVAEIAGQSVNMPGSSSIPTSPAVRSGKGMKWVTATFPSPVTLVAGQTYYLTFTANSGTEYSTDGIREGGNFGYSSATYFSDGYAEKNTGSGWSGFPSPWASSPTTTADLQFYLE